MMRPAPASLLTTLCLCLPACSVFGGLSAEEERRLQGYIENSGRYFNGQDFERAIDQTNRGLALDEDNYQLLTRRAWSYLLWAKPPRNAAGPNREAVALPTRLVLARIDEAHRLFKQLMARRSFDSHDPRVVLGHATALFDRGKLEWKLADLNARQAEAASGADALEFKTRSEQQRARAKALYLLPGAKVFEKIAASERMFFTNRREAYNYLRRIHNINGNKPEAVVAGLRALEMIAAERKYWRPQMGTTDIQAENALRATMRELEAAELAVRQRLATYYRELDQHAKAVEQLNRLITATPRDHVLYYHRAISFRALGMTEQARKDFKTFLVNGTSEDPEAAVNEATRFVYGKAR